MKVRFDSLDPQRGTRSFVLEGYRFAIEAATPAEVVPALRRVEREVAAGRHAGGFLCYEAAPAFDRAMPVRAPHPGLPLLRFGIFDSRRAVAPLEGIGGEEATAVGPLVPAIAYPEYESRVRRILALIAAGDTYQANLTFKLRGEYAGDPLPLYRALCEAQRGAYCALVESGDHALVSASPELFFRRAGGQLEMRPMKGTRPRGRRNEEDQELARELVSSPKERAENLMIVDLLRNDVGRVARFGTVEVPTLFEVERYPTVLQLTSTVRAELREGVDLVELLRALFPSGSVTGAPKIRTMEIIQELEDTARGPYTGAIGFVSPAESVFSVAIRTLVLDRRTGQVEVGVGSGITADAEPAAEFRESLSKGSFLHHRLPRFDLLESLRLGPGETYPLLEGHLERMRDSAFYFGFPFPEEVLRARLQATAQALPHGFHKVRLLLGRAGRVTVEAEPLPEVEPVVQVRPATAPVDPSDRFLFHKTTHRAIYERALSAAPDCDDVILWNERGELTEATRANLVLRLDGEYVTPPLSCGVLPGVLRADLLRDGRITERVLIRADLERAEEIHLINAVRGWRRAVLADREGDSRSTREATAPASP